MKPLQPLQEWQEWQKLQNTTVVIKRLHLLFKHVYITYAYIRKRTSVYAKIYVFSIFWPKAKCKFGDPARDLLNIS